MSTTRHTYLSLDDFPDSPYAAELRRGVSHQRFAPAIEAEYLATHLDRVHLRVKIWYPLVAILTAIFAVVQVRSTGIWSVGSLLLTAVLAPLTIVMSVVVWTRYYQRLFKPLARILPAVQLAAMAFVCAIRIVDGAVQEMSLLAMNVFAIFFFGGLMVTSAVVVSTVMLVSFVISAMIYQMQPDLALTGVVVILMIAGPAAVVGREIETAYRRNFLEGVLIRELAARDGLTGVMNRRAFDEHLLRLWQQGMRDQRTITLMIIDLDHFKALNDRHGHQVGDAALRRVAQGIQNFARRPLDIAARYGGEEFAILLYDFAEPQVNVIAEQVRRAIEGFAVEHGAANAGPVVTVSIGVGVVEPALNRTPHGAIQLADEALYEAKRTGRNRVVVRGLEQYRALETGAFKSAQA